MLRGLLILGSISFAGLVLFALHLGQRPLCIDSKYVERIDRLLGEQVNTLYRCGYYKKASQDSFFWTNANFISNRLRNLERTILFWGSKPPKTRILVVTDKENLRFVKNNVIYLSENTFYENLDSAILEAWIHSLNLHESINRRDALAYVSFLYQQDLENFLQDLPWGRDLIQNYLALSQRQKYLHQHNLSEFLEKGMPSPRKLPTLDYALIKNSQLWLPPFSKPAAENDLSHFKVHRLIIEVCDDPSWQDAIAWSKKAEHLLLVKNCTKKNPLNYSAYLKQDLSSFSLDNIENRFVQIHLPSVELRKDYLLIKETIFASLENHRQHIAQAFHWIHIDDRQGYNRPEAAIDAVTAFR